MRWRVFTDRVSGVTEDRPELTRALEQLRDAPDPATVVALQQRGIIRRRARGGYLELTDDAAFSLHPDNQTGGTSRASTAPPPRH